MFITNFLYFSKLLYVYNYAFEIYCVVFEIQFIHFHIFSAIYRILIALILLIISYIVWYQDNIYIYIFFFLKNAERMILLEYLKI